jgi:predicted outer membrane repeat protein
LATITVNVAFDESDGFVTDGDASLRDAIAVAVAGDTINFASSLNDATLPLTLGQIAFGKNLTIDASMLSSGVTIDAGDTTATQGDGIRIFNITDPTFGSATPLVTLKNLTLKRADSSGAGGAINSAAQLDVQDCKFIDNESTLIGGAIAATFAGRVNGTRLIKIMIVFTLTPDLVGTRRSARRKRRLVRHSCSWKR